MEDREAHLHRGHGVVFEPIERLHGGVVAKADGCEGDEAEVGGSGGGPALPRGKEDGAHEDEAEDEHQVHHDRNHDQVRWHVTFLPNLIETNPSRPGHKTKVKILLSYR